MNTATSFLLDKSEYSYHRLQIDTTTSRSAFRPCTNKVDRSNQICMDAGPCGRVHYPSFAADLLTLTPSLLTSTLDNFLTRSTIWSATCSGATVEDSKNRPS